MRETQSRWVGPAGYIVGLQRSNAWVACGGRCFKVAGEHLREAVGDESHFGELATQKAVALFKKLPKEATCENLAGQEDPTHEGVDKLRMSLKKWMWKMLIMTVFLIA